MVSRVFQKSGAGGGGKKARPTGSGVYTDAGSPSTSSLPPLLDSCLYATSGGGGGQESCSYESESARERVPCFSTTPAAAAFGHPPPQMSGAACGFPSLRSLQENLQLPFFFSAVAAQQNEMGGCGNWAASEQKVAVERSGRPELQQMGTTDLDCLWNYSTNPY